MTINLNEYDADSVDLQGDSIDYLNIVDETDDETGTFTVSNGTVNEQLTVDAGGISFVNDTNTDVNNVNIVDVAGSTFTNKGTINGDVSITDVDNTRFENEGTTNGNVVVNTTSNVSLSGHIPKVVVQKDSNITVSGTVDELESEASTNVTVETEGEGEVTKTTGEGLAGDLEAINSFSFDEQKTSEDALNALDNNSNFLNNIEALENKTAERLKEIIAVNIFENRPSAEGYNTLQEVSDVINASYNIRQAFDEAIVSANSESKDYKLIISNVEEALTNNSALVKFNGSESREELIANLENFDGKEYSQEVVASLDGNYSKYRDILIDLQSMGEKVKVLKQVNNANSDVDMQTTMEDNAATLGLNLEGYNALPDGSENANWDRQISVVDFVLENKVNVKDGSFANATEVKEAFDAGVKYQTAMFTFANEINGETGLTSENAETMSDAYVSMGQFQGVIQNDGTYNDVEGADELEDAITVLDKFANLTNSKEDEVLTDFNTNLTDNTHSRDAIIAALANALISNDELSWEDLNSSNPNE